MANRFDTPYGQKYISTRAELPLDAISTMAQQQQKKYDDVEESAYKLQDLMAKVKAIDPHQPLKQKLDSKYAPKLDAITNKIVAGGDPYANQREIMKVAREFENDPLRLELEKSYDEFGRDIKATEDMKKTKDYTEVYDPMTRKFEGVTSIGEIIPYRSKGIRPGQNYLTIGKELMSDIAKSGYNNKSYKIDSDGNVIGLESGWEGKYKEDIDRVAKNSVTPFLTSKEGEYFIDELHYKNPKISNETILAYAEDYLKKIGNKQIGGISKSGQSFDYSPWALDDHKKAVEMSGMKYLPTFEGNVDPNPTDNKNALAATGMNTTNLDKDGNIDYNAIHVSPESVKKEFDRIQDAYKNKGMSVEEYKQQLENLNRYNVPKMKSNQQIATEHYSDMVRTANNLGFDLNTYTKNGKIDYTTLKNDIITAGKSIQTTAPNITGLQANLAEDLSKFYFGTNTMDADGNSKFNVSSFVNKLSIYEHNNPNSKIKIDSEGIASKLAENAKFIGLDFNDNNLGSMSFVATEGKESVNPKLYSAVTSDAVLKTLMKPIHNFTQETKKALTGKQTKEELKENKQNAIVNLNELANRTLQMKDPNALVKSQNIEKLINSIQNQSQSLVYGTNNDGDKIFISQPRFINGKPQNKVIVVNILDGTIADEEFDLGQIQNEESTNIQMKIAPSYNKDAPGYESKKVIYK